MENETFNDTGSAVGKHSSVYYANPADGSIKEGILCGNKTTVELLPYSGIFIILCKQNEYQSE
jgi:hypothetical protein